MDTPLRKRVLRRPWWRPFKRHLVRNLPRRKRMLNTWLHRVLGNRLFDPLLWKPTEETVARGLMVGTFIGLLPFFGLQILLSIFICYAWRVNVTTAALATFISNPLTAPPIMWAQLKLGRFLLSPWVIVNPIDPVLIQSHWMQYGRPFMTGAIVSATALALLSYPAVHAVWYAVESMRKRTRQRGA